MLDHRANRDLCIRKKRLDRIGQQVRRGMPNDLEAVRIFGGDDSQRAVPHHLKTGVHQTTVYTASQGRFSEPRADRASNLGHGDRASKLAF